MTGGGGNLKMANNMKGTAMRSLPYLAVIAATAICVAMLMLSTERTSAQIAGEPTLVPPINTACTVTLRSDMLTTVYGQTYSGTTPPPFSAQSVAGTLTAINDQWLVVSTAGQDYWIPRNLVVMLQFSK